MLSQSEINRINNQLKYFDCNERESNIYIQSLLTGPCSIQELARKLKMNRVTVHSAVEQLLTKGLFFESRKNKRRIISAENPKILMLIQQKKQEELELTTKNLDYTINLLTSIQKTNVSKPSVKFYEGVSGFKKMLDEILETKNEVLIFSYGELLAKAVNLDYLNVSMRKRAKRGIFTRLIFPPSDYANFLIKKQKEFNSKVKLLPPSFKWSAGFFLWDDKIALLSYSEGERTSTILENKDLAQFFRKVVFEFTWSNLP